MTGRPKGLLKDSASIDAADFFVQELRKLQKRMRLCKVLTPSQRDSPQLKRAKMAVQSQIATLEGVQFLLCEWSKVVKYDLSRSVTYGRGYWRRMEEAGAEGDETEEEDGESEHGDESGDDGVDGMDSQ